MNHEPHNPAHEDDVDAREWAAQERALADERADLAPAASAPGLRTYRLMAHLLAQPLQPSLPPDFARELARRVQPAAARPVDTRLERNLLTLLLAAMALAGLAAAALYGGEWLSLAEQGGIGTLLAKPWLWALAACLGISRLSRPWYPHRHLPA